MPKAPIEAYFPQGIAHIISGEDAKRFEVQLAALMKEVEKYSGESLTIGGNLDAELSKQAFIYSEITQVAAGADAAVDTLKLMLSTVQAYAATKTREAYEDDEVFILPFKSNNMQSPKLAKATEGVIQAAVESYDMVYALNHLLVNAKHVQARFKGIEDGWVQRSIMLSRYAERDMRFFGMPDDVRARGARQAMANERI